MTTKKEALLVHAAETIDELTEKLRLAETRVDDLQQMARNDAEAIRQLNMQTIAFAQQREIERMTLPFRLRWTTTMLYTGISRGSRSARPRWSASRSSQHIS